MKYDPALITTNAGWEAMGERMRRQFLHDCPYCGSKDLWGPHYAGNIVPNPEWRAACNSCHVEMCVEGDLPHGLFDAWNKRSYNIDEMCKLMGIDDQIRLILKLKHGDVMTTTHWNNPSNFS